MIIDYKVIGAKIKRERLRQKIKQEEFANKIKISRGYYSRIETGKSKINLKRLVEISTILNISIDYLLDNSVKLMENNLNYELNIILKKCNYKQIKLICKIAKLVVENKIQ